MTHKLVILFKQPDNPTLFERRWSEEFVPLAEKLPGLHKVGDVTLKRGLTRDLSLWNWVNSALAGNINRPSVLITLLDQTDNPVLSWRLRNAWPRKWCGPVLNAGSSEVAIEELELAHEGLEMSAS